MSPVPNQNIRLNLSVLDKLATTQKQSYKMKVGNIQLTLNGLSTRYARYVKDGCRCYKCGLRGDFLVPANGNRKLVLVSEVNGETTEFTKAILNGEIRTCCQKCSQKVLPGIPPQVVPQRTIPIEVSDTSVHSIQYKKWKTLITLAHSKSIHKLLDPAYLTGDGVVEIPVGSEIEFVKTAKSGIHAKYLKYEFQVELRYIEPVPETKFLVPRIDTIRSQKIIREKLPLSVCEQLVTCRQSDMLLTVGNQQLVINTTSSRYKVFLRDNYTCQSCQAKGT